MASSSDIDHTTSNLSHIYFFVRTDACSQELHAGPAHKSSTSISNGLKQDHSRTSSPRSFQTDGTNGTTTTRSSAELNPLATAFEPQSIAATSSLMPTAPVFAPKSSSISPAPTASQLFELRQTLDKDFGLFATSHIPRGTLIIYEKPLLRITGEYVHSAWDSYCRLNSGEKATFDNLHGHQPEGLNFESASRTRLIDRNDDSMDEEDIEELVAEQIRVMKIFAINNFRLPPSGIGLFATASRLNHSCIPNVHHSYNPTLKKITVYAVKDMVPDEELCITYLGGEAHYSACPRRQELLKSRYGFKCDCQACADTNGFSDRRREFMARVAWGLGQFNNGAKSTDQFIPANNANALKQAEDLIGAMIHEGIVTIELGKAYRFASTYALHLQDYQKAFEYARNEAEVEKDCMGTMIDDLKKNGAASELWVRKIYDTIRAQEGEQALQQFIGMADWKKYMKYQKNKARGKKKAQTNERVNGAQANGSKANGWHTNEGQIEWAETKDTEMPRVHAHTAQTNGSKMMSGDGEEVVNQGIKW